MNIVNKISYGQKNLLIGVSLLTTTTFLCCLQRHTTFKVFPSFFCHFKKLFGRMHCLFCRSRRNVKFPVIDKNTKINISHEELEEQFYSTCKAVQQYRNQISFEDWLIFYGLYKQSTEGNIELCVDKEIEEEEEEEMNKEFKNIEQAKIKDDRVNSIDAQKRKAWKYFHGVSPELTKFLYVQHFDKLFPYAKKELHNNDNPFSTSGSIGFANSISKLKSSRTNEPTHLSLCDLLCQSAALNQIQNVKELIESYPELINEKNSEGLTALHYACDRGNLEMVQFLVEEGANVNIQDSYGETPLHVAKIADELEIINYLLTKGADMNKKNFDGFTPYSIPNY